SANMSSSTVSTYCVVCCHLPRGSVNLKSICFTSLSLIAFRTSWGVLHCSDITIAPLGSQYANSLRALDRVASGFSRPDPNRFLDGGDEDLAVADTAGVGRLLYRLDRPLDHSVFHHDFHFYLRQEVDDVFGAAIKLGVALLPPEAFRLDYGDALDADLVESVLHVVEFERLDDGFDLLHGIPHEVVGFAPWPAMSG